MPALDDPTIHSSDLWLDHPHGQLFARSWAPADQQDGAQQASPIVLFHDSLGCVALWRDFPHLLCAATGRRVIAYDRLGFGRSTTRHDVLGLDFIAEEAAHTFPLIREQLGIQRFIALGHSVGGGMAVHCAARFAASCDALVTISAQFFPEERTLDGIRAAQVQFRDEQQMERLGKYHGDKAHWVFNAWAETWLHPDFATWSLAPTLPLVTSPTLVIHGRQDEYGSERHPESIQAHCAGKVQVAILPEAFHMPHREQPDVTLDLVRRFLADNCPPSPR